jgi:hypothetical protein
MPEVLASAGWLIATTKQRKSTALAWASEASYATGHVKNTPGECLELDQQWMPLSAETLPTGEIEAQLSVAEQHAENFRRPLTCLRHALGFFRAAGVLC